MITGYATDKNATRWPAQKSAIVFFLLFLLVLLLIPQLSFSQNNFPMNQSVPPGSQIDNNQYYGWPNPQTNSFPQQGSLSNSPADNEITARVRAEIAGDRNLSQKAQNITITTQAGRVILQGAVISEYERTSVINMAERAAGTNQVFSQLVVQP